MKKTMIIEGMMCHHCTGRVEKTLSAIDGAVLVNFNDCREAIGARLEGDYYDALHYNAAGAEKFSIFLAQWVRENLDAAPTGRADEALWQSRVEYIRDLLEQPMTAA